MDMNKNHYKECKGCTDIVHISHFEMDAEGKRCNDCMCRMVDSMQSHETDDEDYLSIKHHADDVHTLIQKLIASIKEAKAWGGEDIDIALEMAVKIRAHNGAISDKLLDQHLANGTYTTCHPSTTEK